MSFPCTSIPSAWLAPMSGATDAPFRRQALKFGAPAVVSEMVAGEMLVAARRDVVRKTRRHEGRGLWIVQLAGRRPQDMFDSARLLADAGVDVIDINMGCPSRQVTGGASGSALMRLPDTAKAIIEATLEGAGGRPVTLKMRLGWDGDMLNAPELAQFGQAAGLSLITVHGRTRCQFYTGQANWRAVRATVEAVSLPVICNGDIGGVEDARAALEQSGARGVMIGRAAMGRPWLIGEVGAALSGGLWEAPGTGERYDSLCEQVEESCALYGERLGVKMVRKHVAAMLDHELGGCGWPEEEVRRVRGDLCRREGATALLDGIRHTADMAFEASRPGKAMVA